MRIGKLELICTWRSIEIWWGWKELFRIPNLCRLIKGRR